MSGRGPVNGTVVVLFIGVALSLAFTIHLTFDLAARVHTIVNTPLEETP